MITKITKTQRIKNTVAEQIKELQVKIIDLQVLSSSATKKESVILDARTAGLHTGLGSLILISSKL